MKSSDIRKSLYATVPVEEIFEFLNAQAKKKGRKRDIDSRLKIWLLIRSAEGENGVCWPSLKYLSKMTNLKERRVSQLTRELEREGWLNVKRRGLGKTNLYSTTTPSTKDSILETTNSNIESHWKNNRQKIPIQRGSKGNYPNNYRNKKRGEKSLLREAAIPSPDLLYKKRARKTKPKAFEPSNPPLLEEREVKREFNPWTDLSDEQWKGIMKEIEEEMNAGKQNKRI